MHFRKFGHYVEAAVPRKDEDGVDAFGGYRGGNALEDSHTSLCTTGT
jgi:hypothetical protein